MKKRDIKIKENKCIKQENELISNISNTRKKNSMNDKVEIPFIKENNEVILKYEDFINLQMLETLDFNDQPIPLHVKLDKEGNYFIPSLKQKKEEEKPGKIVKIINPINIEDVNYIKRISKKQKMMFPKLSIKIIKKYTHNLKIISEIEDSTRK